MMARARGHQEPRDSTAATRQVDGRSFAYLFVAVDYLAVGGMRTVLPFMALYIGESAKVGMLEALYGLGQVGGALVIGKWSDRYGRRGALLLSFVGSATGYGLAALAVVRMSPRLLYASRLPVGLAKQTVTTCRAVISDCADGKDRSAAMAHLFGATCAGYAVGPVMGGILVDALSPVVPALVCSTLYLLLVPVTLFMFPETRRPDSSDQGTKKNHHRKAAWRQPSVLRLVGACACPDAAIVMGATGVPLLTRQFGWSASRLGFLNTCFGFGGGLVAWALAPWLRSGKVTDGTATLLGAVSLASGSLIVATVGTPGALWTSLPCYVLAIALLRTSPATLITRFSHGTHGEALGLLDASNSLCRIIAPIIASKWADWRSASASAAFESQAFAALLGVLLLLSFSSRSRRPDSSDSSSSSWVHHHLMTSRRPEEQQLRKQQ